MVVPHFVVESFRLWKLQSKSKKKNVCEINEDVFVPMSPTKWLKHEEIFSSSGSMMTSQSSFDYWVKKLYITTNDGPK